MKIKHTMYSVQDYNILYNSVVRILLRCWKYLYDSIILLRWEECAHKTSLIRHFLLKFLHQPKKVSGYVDVYLTGINFECPYFYGFSICFWNCSDSLVFVFHFLFLQDLKYC